MEKDYLIFRKKSYEIDLLSTTMNDADIRKFLHRKNLKKYHRDPDSRVLDEFGVCQGEARVDIAVINGEILGYEIKSAKDTLDRLPKQEIIYSKVFDKMTIVVDEKKTETTLKMIPSWWGVMVAFAQNESLLCVEKIRGAQKNDNVNARALVELLWKKEALDILRVHNCHRGFSGKTRAFIWDKLTDTFDLNELQRFVRAAIKSRDNWRIGRQIDISSNLASNIKILKQYPIPS